MSRQLFLASGMQSGGTTVLSWCFLQHPELDGLLDMPTDILFDDFSSITSNKIWIKMTVSAFRWSEVAHVYQQFGFEVKPLLIVRNPYHVYSSLRKKWYGKNGLTAEDPPLILRFLRFQKDIQLFVKNGWPIIKYEDFVSAPETQLHRVTEELGLDWSSDMLIWPKPISSFLMAEKTNATFEATIGTKQFGDIVNLQKPAYLSQAEVDWIDKHLSFYLNYFSYEKPELTLDEEIQLLPNKYDDRRQLGMAELEPDCTHKRKMASLVETLKDRQIQCVNIVGTGYIAQTLSEFCDTYNIQVNRYYDSYSQTDKFLNKEVRPLDEISDQYPILVGSLGSAKKLTNILIHKLSIPLDKVFVISKQVEDNF